MFRVVIPARYASTRLPGKPLVLLGGLPLVLHVHRAALSSGAAQVVIATDDDRILETCTAAGADVEMTDAAHPSGTDRIAEVAARRGWAPDSIVVNVQGDEPLLPPALIAQVAELLASDAAASIATLAAPIDSPEAYHDTNVVKVVAGQDGHALYFSRAPIPWLRDATHGVQPGARRHIGIYAYRVGVLTRLAAMPPSTLEQVERLEQLRALQAGIVIAVDDAIAASGPGIDTPEDLRRAEASLSRGSVS